MAPVRLVLLMAATVAARPRQKTSLCTMAMKILLLVSVVALALAGSMAPVGAAGDRPRRADALNQELQQGLDNVRNENAIPGAALSISLPGERSVRTFTSGTTMLDATTPGSRSITASDLFGAASILKTMTAVLILQLEHDGKLSLDDQLARLLPQYPAWGTVTVRQLLNMTSGIPNYTQTARFAAATVTDRQRQWTPAELVDTAYTTTPNPVFQPGAGWQYSNTNYILAGMLIQRVTHQSYATVLQNRILGPHGAALHHTYYEPSALPNTLLRQTVHGYDRDGPLPRDTDTTGFNNSDGGAAGALFSTTHDIARWTRQLFHGTILATRQLHELTNLVSQSSGAPTDLNDPAAFGLGVEHRYDPTFPVWSKGGLTLGYVFYTAWLPCLNTTIAIAQSVSNSRTGGAIPAIQIGTLQELNRSPEFQHALARHPTSTPGDQCPSR
jgi:D-alanyl-D-alanine carboxypeptidase